MRDTAVFFMDHLNDLPSWDWEMVQFSCPVPSTQGTEAILRREWTLSSWVGLEQPKPRVWEKQVVL